MKDISTQKYPLSMILFHSLIAILMITALILGWMAEDNRDLLLIHKSIGVSVLLFAVLRLINRLRFVGKLPESVNIKGSAQYIAEKSIHGLLMLTMLGIPVVGWLISNAKGYPASFFGLFNLPSLMGKNEDLAETLAEMHELGANVFVALLILHILGGLIHLIKKKNNVFLRMKP